MSISSPPSALATTSSHVDETRLPARVHPPSPEAGVPVGLCYPDKGDEGMDSEEAIGKFVVAYPEYAAYRESLTLRKQADGSFAIYLSANRRPYSSSSSIIQVGWVKTDGSYCFRQKHLQDAKRHIRFVEWQREQP